MTSENSPKMRQPAIFSHYFLSGSTSIKILWLDFYSSCDIGTLEIEENWGDAYLQRRITNFNTVIPRWSLWHGSRPLKQLPFPDMGYQTFGRCKSNRMCGLQVCAFSAKIGSNQFVLSIVWNLVQACPQLFTYTAHTTRRAWKNERTNE